MREANHALLRANQAIADTEVAQNNAANEAEKAKSQKETLHQTITKRKSWDEIAHSEISSKEAVFRRTEHEQTLMDKQSLLYATYETQEHSSIATATAAANASSIAVSAANERLAEETGIMRQDELDTAEAIAFKKKEDERAASFGAQTKEANARSEQSSHHINKWEHEAAVDAEARAESQRRATAAIEKRVIAEERAKADAHLQTQAEAQKHASERIA